MVATTDTYRISRCLLPGRPDSLRRPGFSAGLTSSGRCRTPLTKLRRGNKRQGATLRRPGRRPAARSV